MISRKPREPEYLCFPEVLRGNPDFSVKVRFADVETGAPLPADRGLLVTAADDHQAFPRADPAALVARAQASR